MTLFNLKNVINKPTRITTRSSTLLDPIMISDTRSSIYSDVLNVPSEISDHDAAVAYITVVKELRSEMLCHLPVQVK